MRSTSSRAAALLCILSLFSAGGFAETIEELREAVLAPPGEKTALMGSASYSMYWTMEFDKNGDVIGYLEEPFMTTRCDYDLVVLGGVDPMYSTKTTYESFLPYDKPGPIELLETSDGEDARRYRIAEQSIEPVALRRTYFAMYWQNPLYFASTVPGFQSIKMGIWDPPVPVKEMLASNDVYIFPEKEVVSGYDCTKVAILTSDARQDYQKLYWLWLGDEIDYSIVQSKHINLPQKGSYDFNLLAKKVGGGLEEFAIYYDDTVTPALFRAEDYQFVDGYWIPSTLTCFGIQDGKSVFHNTAPESITYEEFMESMVENRPAVMSPMQDHILTMQSVCSINLDSSSVVELEPKQYSEYLIPRGARTFDWNSERKLLEAIGQSNGAKGYQMAVSDVVEASKAQFQ